MPGRKPYETDQVWTRRFNRAQETAIREVDMLLLAHVANVQGIPRLVALPEMNGSLAIIMEDGGRFASRYPSQLIKNLRSTSLGTIGFYMDIIGQTLAVLMSLHRIGIAHLDVKPSNIVYKRVVDGNNPEPLHTVTLVDLGSAQSFSADGTVSELLSFSEGYVDPAALMTVFEERNADAEANRHSAGRINAFHYDMYALSVVTTKLFSSWFGINTIHGVYKKSGTGMPAELKPLLNLASRATSLNLRDRLDINAVKEHEFFQTWRRDSRSPPGSSMPAGGGAAAAAAAGAGASASSSILDDESGPAHDSNLMSAEGAAAAAGASMSSSIPYDESEPEDNGSSMSAEGEATATASASSSIQYDDLGSANNPISVHSSAPSMPPYAPPVEVWWGSEYSPTSTSLTLPLTLPSDSDDTRDAEDEPSSAVQEAAGGGGGEAPADVLSFTPISDDDWDEEETEEANPLIDGAAAGGGGENLVEAPGVSPISDGDCEGEGEEGPDSTPERAVGGEGVESPVGTPAGDEMREEEPGPVQAQAGEVRNMLPGEGAEGSAGSAEAQSRGEEGLATSSHNAHVDDAWTIPLRVSSCLEMTQVGGRECTHGPAKRRWVLRISDASPALSEETEVSDQSPLERLADGGRDHTGVDGIARGGGRGPGASGSAQAAGREGQNAMDDERAEGEAERTTGNKRRRDGDASAIPRGGGSTTAHQGTVRSTSIDERYQGLGSSQLAATELGGQFNHAGVRFTRKRSTPARAFSYGSKCPRRVGWGLPVGVDYTPVVRMGGGATGASVAAAGGAATAEGAAGAGGREQGQTAAGRKRPAAAAIEAEDALDGHQGKGSKRTRRAGIVGGAEVAEPEHPVGTEGESAGPEDAPAGVGDGSAGAGSNNGEGEGEGGGKGKGKGRAR